jgi:MoxR-like ATPase
MAARSTGKETRTEAPARSTPLGVRVESVLEVAYRARRPVLLEGATGIGKSELVASVAKKLGIGYAVLDLSLLEPPDLVGLPVIEGGRTRYATPRALPASGAGLLMLEELNRAERFIQQPALQLLTARRLHEYELPEGWSCVAAINPENGEYQVTPLDPALRARFLNIRVHAERGSWLTWAGPAGVHPAVVALVRAHERAFETVSPRSWTYASDVLRAMNETELKNSPLLSDVLSGYLPTLWVDALVQSAQLARGAIAVDVHAVLREYSKGSARAAELETWKREGRTDRIDELKAALATVLKGPEAGVLAAQGDLELGRLESLLGDLPGDVRHDLQDAIAGNPTLVTLLDVRAADVLTNYEGSSAQRRVAEWKSKPVTAHRVGLLVTAVRSHVLTPAVTQELRRSNAQRISLGHFLAQVGERFGVPLAEALHRIGVTPIRPGT